MKFSTALTTMLSTMDYPAHPSDLLREAQRDGIQHAEIAQLGLLPNRAYQGSLDVARTLVHHAETTVTSVD